MTTGLVGPIAEPPQRRYHPAPLLAAVTCLTLAAVINGPVATWAVFALPALALVALIGGIAAAAPGAAPNVRLVPSLAEIAFVLTLVAAAGGPDSIVGYAALAIPLLWINDHDERQVALLSALLVGGLAGAALIEGSTATAATIAAAGTWIGLVAAITAFRRCERDARTTDIVRTGQALVEQVVAAEERAHRRMADALHDGPLQSLIAAKQDLDEATGGPEDESLGFARSALENGIAEARALIRGMAPASTGAQSLRAALASLCQGGERRGGYRWTVEVVPELEDVDDPLVISIARELILNAAKHACADNLEVRVDRDGALIRLTVSDDGVGVSPSRIARARNDGHLGMTSVRERAESAGGVIHLRSRPSAGTVVEVLIPQLRARTEQERDPIAGILPGSRRTRLIDRRKLNA